MKYLNLSGLGLIALIAVSLSSHIFAFGANGHRIVAQIAEEHLTDLTKAKVMKITEGKPLAQLASWPDDIKSQPFWDYVKPWHFLSINDDESFKGLKRSKDGDLWQALDKFEKELGNPNVKGEKRWRALAFYIHFMGDIHQPLHVGRRDDLGGNSVEVKWFGESTNLHTVWDSLLLGSELLSFSEYVRFLDHTTEAEIKKWQSASYLDYAKESKALRVQVYNMGKDKDGELPNLGYDYSYKHITVINECMLKGGIRLAGRLNQIFDPQ